MTKTEAEMTIHFLFREAVVISCPLRSTMLSRHLKAETRIDLITSV
jgi:hypothetical protein